MNSVLVLMSAYAAVPGIGDRMVRTFEKYVEMPTTVEAARGNGWKPYGKCDPLYGIPYSNSTEGTPSRHHPTTLYFTNGGLVSGISVDIFGAAPPQKQVAMNLYEKIAADVWRLGVAFRGNPCAEGNSTYPIGDRLVVAPKGAKRTLPLTRADAVAGNWTAGSCFYGMGTHYFYDLATAPKMSWEAENVLPIITMFNNNDEIQAFFFTSWDIEQQIGDTDDWEGIPLENILMCKNMCDSSCHFTGTHFWSTYHVYFKDLNDATCPNNCKIACCQNDLWQ